MNITFTVGIIGSVITVLGAIWQDTPDNSTPTKSVKNWLFFTGSLFLLLYAFLGYFAGSPIFFVLLEGLVLTSCILTMLPLSDKVKTLLIIIAGIGFLGYALQFFTDSKVIYFVGGLIILCMGYAFQNGTMRKLVALTVGSILLTWYSYLEASWIFFWLNFLFTVFTGYYLWKMLQKK